MEELEDKNQQTLRPIDVERTLGSLPHGLEESYNRIIQRIQIQDQLLEECLVALKWLVFSKEPLLIEELVDACVLTPSSKSTWDPERRLNPVDLLNNLVGLVAVRTSYGRRIVSLAHLSVREYLLPQQRKRAPQLEVLSDFDFHSTHKFIAQSCLTYLVHCALAKDNNFYGYDNMMDGYALRNYAWHWWASHAAASVYSNDSRATRLAMRLFNSLAFRMLYQDDNESAETDRTLKDLTGHFRSLEVTALRRVLANPRFSSGPRSSKSLFVLPPYINHLHDEVWDYAVGPYPMLRTLPDDQQALRLFILHPPRDGAPFDLLEGSLCMEFLENGSLYTALSYTTHLTIPALLPEEFDQQSSQQGLQPRDSMIRIHGADLSVTPSLLGALLTLRHPTRDRVLWLDTLCLSRHPPFERSALVQTQRMFDIYCNAKEVALWLGSESSSSKEVMLLLGAASDEPTKVVDALATKSVTESIAARPNAHDLDEFFSRSIWWRLWVIQEIIGGAHVKLYCGRLSLDYDTMKTVDEIYHDQDSQHSPHFGETQRSAHSTRGISPRSNAAWLQRLRREYLSGKRAELTELLHLTCNYSCYLPEDRVIALLALLPDTDAADLATLLGESSTWVGKLPYVYGAATQHIITKSQGLDILAYAPGPELRISTFALPSWIPNWEKLDPPILETRLYNACNGHPESPSFSFPHEKKFFAINGVVVGHISRLENVFQPSLLHESSQSLSPSKKLEPVRQAPEGQTQAEMYWRTVSTDLWVAEGKAPRRIGKEGGSMAGWKQLVSQHRRDDNGAQRVIYTENGFLGSTYCSAQEEDLVILLPGGRTPFVVRRTDTYESRLHFPGEPIPSAVRSLESKSLDCITCRLIGQR